VARYVKSEAQDKREIIPNGFLFFVNFGFLKWDTSNIHIGKYFAKNRLY
jgi:hypothetical protein